MVYRGYAPAGGGDLPYSSRDYHSASEHGEDYLDGPRLRDDYDSRSIDSMPYRRGGRRDEDDGPPRDRRPFRSRSGDSRDERPRYLDGPRRPDRLMDRSVDRPMDRSLDRPMDRSVDRSRDRSVDRPLDRSVDRSMDRSMDRPLERPMGGPRMRSNRDDRHMDRPRSSRYRDEDDYDHHRENPRYSSRKESRTMRSRSRSQDESDDYPRYRDRKDGPRYPVDGRYPENARYRQRGGWSGHSSRHDTEDSTPVPLIPEEPTVKNMYQNDGSFLEMFKKMQEAQNPKPEETANTASETDGAGKSDDLSSVNAPKKPATSIVGKRRGGRVLPTGMVKKLKREDEEEKPTNAWSIYMAEVRKYKEASCEEEGKTRPLVK